MKALITLDKKSADPGAVFSLANQIRSEFKARDVEAKVRVFKGERQIEITSDALSKENLNELIERKRKGVKYDFEVEYVPSIRERKSAQNTDHAPYEETIKAKYFALREKMESYERRIQELEAQFKSSEAAKRSAELRAKQLEAKCARIGDVRSFPHEIIIRANSEWENLIKWYYETLEAGSDISGIKVRELEERCLNYVDPRESSVFKRIREKYKKAKEAEEASQSNPFIELSKDAKKIIEEGDKILSEGENVRFVRDEIINEFSKTEMRMFLTPEDDNAILAIPFRYKSSYEGLEKSFLERLKSYLDKSGLEFEEENYRGFLRIRIKNAKTRRRKSLATLIVHDNQDIFGRLGGVKRIYGLEIYG